MQDGQSHQMRRLERLLTIESHSTAALVAAAGDILQRGLKECDYLDVIMQLCGLYGAFPSPSATRHVQTSRQTCEPFLQQTTRIRCLRSHDCSPDDPSDAGLLLHIQYLSFSHQLVIFEFGCAVSLS